MREKIIQLYVANKVAKNNSDVALMKQAVRQDDFVRQVLSFPLTMIPVSLKLDIEKKLTTRLGTKSHRSIFSKARTIGQWIHDVTSLYTADDIITSLTQSTGLGRQYFESESIAHLDRVYLIDLVEGFEQATGRKLLKNDDLAYLGDDYTYRQMASFFSA